MTTSATALLRHVRRLASDTAEADDGRLLARFATTREEAAFEDLLRRHGPMVLGVCRRVLRHEHDIEDVFQTTFLALARRAGRIRDGASVGGWLYRVAFHAAIKLRAAANRPLPPPAADVAADPLNDITGRELLSALDEELARLPGREREPLVLCYLQGLTRDEAARRLGMPLGTFKRRLEQGKARLKMRLSQRGLALPSALLAAGMAGGSASAALAERTLRAALAIEPARHLGRWIVVLLAALLAGAGLYAGRTPPADEPKPVAPLVKGDSLTGRVVDAKGRPVANARVAVSGYVELGSLTVELRDELLGEATTDKEGRFRLPWPGGDPRRWGTLHVLAGAAGYGLVGRRLHSKEDNRDLTLTLPPERVASLRLIDLQGLPVAGATLRPVRVRPARPPETPGKDNERALKERILRDLEGMGRTAFDLTPYSALEKASLWPAAVASNADGRFRLSGFGAGQEVELLVEHDGFARQMVVARPDGGGPVSVALRPAQRITGRAVAADTGLPVAGAWVSVLSFREDNGSHADGRTDADGRFAVNATLGDRFRVDVYPPNGVPYLAVLEEFDWPKGAVRRDLAVRLPRGVVVRGRVEEEKSRKPIDSANIEILPQIENNPLRPRGLVLLADFARKVFTRADGRFETVVPLGTTRLLVTGPNPDYAEHRVTEGEIRSGKEEGDVRKSVHEVVRLEVKAGDGPRDVVVTLRRGAN